MRKIKKWVCEHKDEPFFKHTVLIIVLIILAIGAQLYDNIRSEWENEVDAETAVTEEVSEEEDGEKENAVTEFLDNSKVHIFLLLVTGTALVITERNQKHKIRESK